MKVQVSGDTIKLHVRQADTLFLLSDSNVLKKFKGYYFLNYRADKNTWWVQKLSLTKGVLTIGNITDSAAISHLKQLTESPQDTTSLPFSPTKKQFKRFLQSKGFSDQDVYQRIPKR